MAPAWATGLPLSQQLSSDAEWYAAAMYRSAEPPEIAVDPSQPLDIRPAGEQLLTAGVARIGQWIGVDLLDWSILVSIASLLLFVGAVYLAVLLAAGPVNALIVATASIVPVHALGGATYGFQPLGFLPRDLMLGPAILIVAAYGAAIRRGSRAILLVFFLCGIAANAYPVLFAHLTLCLAGAEVIRRRRLDLTLIGHLAAAGLGAAPAAVDVLSRSLIGAQIDVELVRFRMDYQIIDSIPLAITQYLRRTIVYASLVSVVWWLVRRHAPPQAAHALEPWFALCVSSLVLSIGGVIIESSRPEFIKYLLSRTSVFFIFASMVVICVGVRALPLRVPRYGRGLAILGVLTIFALQSAAPSVVRNVAETRASLPERVAFQAAAREVRKLTAFDDVVVAPSDEVPDLAASLRTYSRRPVWQTYKDLGVAQVDGVRARRGFERWTDMQAALNSGELDRILAFMASNDIRAAVLPISSLGPAEHGRPEIAARANGYVVVVAP